MADRTTAAGHRPVRRSVLLTGGLLAVACAVAASGGRPGDLSVTPQQLAGTRLDMTDLLSQVPSWLTVLAASVTGTLLLLLTLPLLVLGLRRLWQLLLQALDSARRPRPASRRGRRPGAGRPARSAAGSGPGGPATAAERAALRAALAAPAAQAAQTLRDDAGRDPGIEVIRCWEAVERAAATSGAARRPGDTPAEFARTVLESFRVDRGQLGILLQVYRRARFSRRPLTADEVGRARQAFAVLAGQLGTAPATLVPQRRRPDGEALR